MTREILKVDAEEIEFYEPSFLQIAIEYHEKYKATPWWKFRKRRYYKKHVQIRA